MLDSLVDRREQKVILILLAHLADVRKAVDVDLVVARLRIIVNMGESWSDFGMRPPNAVDGPAKLLRPATCRQ